MALSLKHQAFVDSFLIHNRNATEAYCDVYGVDRAVGSVSGARLLANDKIQAEIKRRTDEMLMTPEEVLTRLADIARGDVADLMSLSTAGYEFELLIDDGNGNKIRNPKTKLIKKIRQKVTIYSGKKSEDEDRQVIETELELYAADDAIMDIAKLSGMVVDHSENYNIDMDTLTVDQLDRLARGEKLANVLKRPTA